MRVYVAGASAEIARAESAIKALRATKIFVTSNWPESVRRVGTSNPRDASHIQRKGWAYRCISEARSADVLWLLVPERPSAGAYFEFGMCFAERHLLIASGNLGASIFGAVAHEEFATDEEALRYLRGRAASYPEIPF